MPITPAEPYRFQHATRRIALTEQKLVLTYRQSPWRFQLQLIGSFLLALVFLALIAGIYLNVTSRAATIGRRIQAMQNQIQHYRRLNADLETQLARLTAAEQFEARARDLGFGSVGSGQVTYIMVPGYHGRSPTVLAPPPGPSGASEAALPPEFTQSLIEWMAELRRRPPLSLIRVLP